MKQNIGPLDQKVRIGIGIIALFIGYFILTDTAQTIAYVIGFIGIITGSIKFCGLYTLLGITTCPRK